MNYRVALSRRESFQQENLLILYGVHAGPHERVWWVNLAGQMVKSRVFFIFPIIIIMMCKLFLTRDWDPSLRQDSRLQWITEISTLRIQGLMRTKTRVQGNQADFLYWLGRTIWSSYDLPTSATKYLQLSAKTPTSGGCWDCSAIEWSDHLQSWPTVVRGKKPLRTRWYFDIQ